MYVCPHRCMYVHRQCMSFTMRECRPHVFMEYGWKYYMCTVCSRYASIGDSSGKAHRLVPRLKNCTKNTNPLWAWSYLTSSKCRLIAFIGYEFQILNFKTELYQNSIPSDCSIFAVVFPLLSQNHLTCLGYNRVFNGRVSKSAYP